MANVDELKQQLADIEAQIHTLQEALAGLPTEVQERSLLPVREEAASIRARLAEKGAVVQGNENQALGAGAVAVEGDVSGSIITGDHVNVMQIIYQYGENKEVKVDETAVRRQISSYLTWMRDGFSRIELRGIKRMGQQVVQLDLETVYVPLTAVSYASLPVTTHAPMGDFRPRGPRDIELDQIMKLGRRLILTGGPGCGKTTVLLHLACIP